MSREKLEMLTDKQTQVLQFIGDYIRKHEFSPNQSEIAAAIGSAGPNVCRILDSLERKGYVTREFRRHRNIKVLKEAA